MSDDLQRYYDESLPPSLYPTPPDPTPPATPILESTLPTGVTVGSSLNSIQLIGSGFEAGMTATIDGQSDGTGTTTPGTDPTTEAWLITTTGMTDAEGPTTIHVTNPGAPTSNTLTFTIWPAG